MVTAATAQTGEELFEAYEDVWRRLKSGSKVAAELELTADEHYQLAAYGVFGARRVVERRRAR